MWRAAMINRAIFWAVIASIAVTLLVIVAFITAFLQLQHEHGVAIFFLISLGAWDVRRFPLIYVGKQTFSASGGLSQSFQQRTDAMPRW
jgi:hypothetical protein